MQITVINDSQIPKTIADVSAKAHHFPMDYPILLVSQHHER